METLPYKLIIQDVQILVKPFAYTKLKKRAQNPAHFPASGRSQCVLVVWWLNNTIGPSRLVAMIRSAYRAGARADSFSGSGGRITPLGPLDCSLFSARRMEFAPRRGRPACRPVRRKAEICSVLSDPTDQSPKLPSLIKRTISQICHSERSVGISWENVR